MADDTTGTQQETKGDASAVDTRLGALEARQERQENLLQQILDRLPGQSPSSGSGTRSADTGSNNIADLIRQGVDELEQNKARKQREDDANTARRDHAERLAALEEAMPREPAATPAGRLRSWAQMKVFGIDDPHR